MRKSMMFFAIAISSLTSLSEAEEVDDILLFGDSYFDTGAGNALAKPNSQLQPNPQPPYATGTHTNGPNWVDFTSDVLELPFQNYAVSGSTNGTENEINPVFGGIANQIQRKQATAPYIGSETLAILDGGANDVLRALRASGANSTTIGTAVVQSLQSQAANLQQILIWGAQKTIVWNLWDLSGTPFFTNTGLGQTLSASAANLATVGYNAGLQTVVQTINKQAPGHQQVYIFDANYVINQITAQLKAEGIDLTKFTVNPAISNVPIAGSEPEVVAYYDPLTLNSRVFQLFSSYIAGYIDTLYNAPRYIGAQLDLAFEGTRAFRNSLDNHFRTLHIQEHCRPCDWDPCCLCMEDRFQYYMDINSKWGSTPSKEGSCGLDYNTQVYLVGADFYLNRCMTLGASFAYQTNNARVIHHGLIDLDDYIPTLYASYNDGCYFADVSFSYHAFDFKKLHRRIPFLDRTAKAKTTGQGEEITVNFGQFYECGCITAIPLIGFDFTHINIKGYRERHADFLDLDVKCQHNNSFVSKVGGQVFWNACACGISPFAELFWEHEFMRAGHIIAPRFHRKGDGAKIYNRTSSPSRDVLKFAVGLSSHFNDCFSGNISYEGETTFDVYNNSLRTQIDFVF